jgi:hypothetical protein
LISVLLIGFQSYLLINKYIQTISIRENYDSCAAVCVELEASDNIANNTSRSSLKNNDLSALIFLNSLSNNFLLFNAGGISELSYREFNKFMEVFTNGKIVNVELPVKSEALKIDFKNKNIERSSFPWFDMGPVYIANYGSSNVEVLSYRENKSTIISYVIVLDDISRKLLIVDKKLLLND